LVNLHHKGCSSEILNLNQPRIPFHLLANTSYNAFVADVADAVVSLVGGGEGRGGGGECIIGEERLRVLTAGAVEGWCGGAGVGVAAAGEGVLVELLSCGTPEREAVEGVFAVVGLDRCAHVEHLAVAILVGEVTLAVGVACDSG